MNDMTKLEPWQWPEAHWRSLVNQVRAGRSYRPKSWKGGARCAFALSFDSDHETNELRDGGKSIGRMAWGQYGNRVGVPSILKLLAKHSVPATFYVPAVAALLHGDEQRRVIAEGHEIGIHSWIHELNSVLPYEAEKDLMMRAADVLEKTTKVRPVGARTASWDFSPHTLRITRATIGGVSQGGFISLRAALVAPDRVHSLLLFDTEAGALLIFGQDGDPHAVERDLARIARACEAEGASEVRIASSPAEAATVLAARRAVLPSLSRLEPLTILEDATVPRSRIAEMVEHIQVLADRYELKIGTFGHAGDGNLHPTAVLDPADEDALQRAHHVFDEIFAKAIELGGSITGEHGVGIVKLPHLERQLGAAHVALLRRIKTAFDPHGILNPGKLGS